MRAIWAGALLAGYLTVTGGVLVLGPGRDAVSPGTLVLHGVLLAAALVATWWPGMPRWVRTWMPVAALLFLYSEMPAIIAAAGHSQLRDATVVRWEDALFGGQPARTFAAAMPWRALSELLHAGYLSYYAVIVSVPAILQLQRRPRDASDAVFVLLLPFVACFLLYAVFPVAGPRYLWPPDPLAREGTLRAVTLWLLDARSSRGTAFPSSHVAVAVTQSILAARYFGARGWWIGGTTVLLALGAIHGGYHYAVDVLAGALLGLLCALLGLVLVRRSQANATAPT